MLKTTSCTYTYMYQVVCYEKKAFNTITYRQTLSHFTSHCYFSFTFSFFSLSFIFIEYISLNNVWMNLFNSFSYYHLSFSLPFLCIVVSYLFRWIQIFCCDVATISPPFFCIPPHTFYTTTLRRQCSYPTSKIQISKSRRNRLN